MTSRTRTTAAHVLAALVLVHVGWGLARVPGKVVMRRVDDIAAYRERGGAAYFLGKDLRGAAAIEWVLANTPPDAAVLWDGDPMGSLEFAPTLLAPRLLVHAALCPTGAVSAAGLSIARATLGDRTGVVVLVASPKDLRVEVR